MDLVFLGGKEGLQAHLHCIVAQSWQDICSGWYEEPQAGLKTG